MVSQDSLRFSPLGKGKQMHLSFSGCGFLGLYHVGVVSCIKEYAPHLATGKVAGASAGALAACGLVTDCNLGEATSYILNVALKARSRALGPLHPSFNIVKYLRDGMEAFLPADAHIKASGHLYVSLTRVYDRRNVLVSQFDTREDLIEALICSAFVPFYCGILPPKYKGVRYIDGGISDNVPDLGENTITVSPFSGESDICPKDYSSNLMLISLANTSIQFTAENFYRFSRALFPPHPEVLSKMCRQGFDDCLKYLQRNNMISCTRHFSIQSSITSATPVDIDNFDPNPLEITPTPSFDEMSVDSDSSGYVDFFESDDEEEEVHSDDGCDECKRRRHVALLDNLPSTVISALQMACDSVNSGLFSTLYDYKVFHALSLMTAPWLLPLDLVIAMGQKFFDWAPYMPSDMQWFISEFVKFMQDVFHIIQSHRHRYSARFSCQLAITEMNYRDEDKVTQRQRHRSKSLTPHALHAGATDAMQLRKSLNFGFSVDFQSHCQSPLSRLTEMRQHILNEEEHVELTKLPHSASSADLSPDALVRDLHKLSPIQSHSPSPPPAASSLPTRPSSRPSSRRSSLTQDASYDTFENCLHIADQMDALLSFYYMEENNPNVVKVTEIFPLADPRSPKPSFDTSDLVWDNFMEMKREDGTASTGTSSGNPLKLGRSASLAVLEDWSFTTANNSNSAS